MSSTVIRSPNWGTQGDNRGVRLCVSGPIWTCSAEILNTSIEIIANLTKAMSEELLLLSGEEYVFFHDPDPGGRLLADP